MTEALLNAGAMARLAHAALDENPWQDNTRHLCSMLFDPNPGALQNVRRVLEGVGRFVPQGSAPGNDRTDENEIVRQHWLRMKYLQT